MSIDYKAILIRDYSNNEWTLDGDNYEGLTWLSDSPKPSKAELDALWPEVEAQIKAEHESMVTARQTALVKLAALGLTEAEIQALVG